MNPRSNLPEKPDILAPAGSKASFLAALAAGAEAIYCGLKAFSARMEAKNFGFEDLGALVSLAHDKGTKVYVTLNTMVKPDELDRMIQTIERLKAQVQPDGLIVQDLGVVHLAKHAGFPGEIHLSTLANVTFPQALEMIRKNLPVARVVMPRELNIDELKAMAAACPDGIKLEVFVHGALCYGVSGRCYWSSFLGGKSGLRGRCVQPCRRLYGQGESKKRFFSCQDLSLDVLVKVVREIPQIAAWKIEGRKKGPHYVYYTVQAYRLLRDHHHEPNAKRSALQLLERALGRSGTHYHFLPQRPQNPIKTRQQTGSGFLMGSVKGTTAKPFVTPKEELIPSDVLRVGYEDDPWHAVYRIRKHVPKGGRFYLNTKTGKTPKKGSPIFLTDRREKALSDMIHNLEAELENKTVQRASFKARKLKVLVHRIKSAPPVEVNVFRRLDQKKMKGGHGVWLSSPLPVKRLKGVASKMWWCLPPVVWPENADEIHAMIQRILKAGGRQFVLNAPWQAAFFKNRAKLELWAGPFCNTANVMALKSLKSFGFSGAVVSPELGKADILNLPRQSPIPLGIVVSGHWPLCTSRILSEEIEPAAAFASPRGEGAWVAEHGPDYWIFPNWKLDLTGKKRQLAKAGYKLFIHLHEPIPKGIPLKKRPGLWNWDVGLK